MSSTSLTSPDAIARLLDLIEANTKSLPYSDVGELEKFTELATAAVESMVSLARVALVRFDAQLWNSVVSTAISSLRRLHATLLGGQRLPRRCWSGS